MSKSTELGMSVFLRKQGLFLTKNVDDIKNGCKEAEYGSHAEEMNEKC